MNLSVCHSLFHDFRPMSYSLTTKTFIAMLTIAEIRLLHVHSTYTNGTQNNTPLEKNISMLNQFIRLVVPSLLLVKPELLDGTCHLPLCTDILSEEISLLGYGHCHESDVAKALQHN